jgi:hypothetical protein
MIPVVPIMFRPDPHPHTPDAVVASHASYAPYSSLHTLSFDQSQLVDGRSQNRN